MLICYHFPGCVHSACHRSERDGNSHHHRYGNNDTTDSHGYGHAYNNPDCNGYDHCNGYRNFRHISRNHGNNSSHIGGHHVIDQPGET
jgi:hypothetical protein